MNRVEIRSLEDMRAFGRRIAEALQDADVVGLVGDLGAGKTTLVQAVAQGLGVPANVPILSPTFTFHHVYAGGRLPVHHFDLYRIEAAAELEALGLDEHVGRRGVALIEWFDRLGAERPPDSLVVSIALRPEPDQGEWRDVELSADGPRSRAIMEALSR